MLTADVRFEGWTTEDWVRFVDLWKPRASVDREPTRPRGGLVVVHEAGRIRKAVHTRRGRLDVGGSWPQPWPGLTEQHRASWGLAVHTGALEEIMERFGARARRGDDLLEQSLSLMQIAREMIAEDAVELWPRRLRGVPLPKEAMVRRSLDTLCPDGHSLCLGLFKEGELWTALAARRRGKGFDVIAGPDELRPGIGLLSGEWPRDYRHIARAVEEKYAPLAFGCFAEVDTFRSLQTNPNPGAWSRAVAMRDIILSPTPLAVGVALSFDTMRFALDNFRSMTGVDPFGFAEPMYRVVRSRIGQAAGDKDVSTALGFDPLAVLRALLSR